MPPSSSAVRSAFDTGYPPGPVRRFTVAEYHRMIEAGVLTSEDSVELLEGWIVPKMVRNAPHDFVIVALNRRIAPKLPEDWLLFPQCALTLEDSEPEPDLMIVRGPEERFAEAHPTAADVALIIEVADATVEHDRDVKGRIYARAGIPSYWLISIPDARIEVYSQPSTAGATPQFSVRKDYGLGRTVPLTIGGRRLLSLKVREVLP